MNKDVFKSEVLIPDEPIKIQDGHQKKLKMAAKKAQI